MRSAADSADIFLSSYPITEEVEPFESNFPKFHLFYASSLETDDGGGSQREKPSKPFVSLVGVKIDLNV